jgi:uncharacterized repeat protein (TIGR01451 family)
MTCGNDLFLGWSETPGGPVTRLPGDTFTITEDKLFFAQWDPNPDLTVTKTADKSFAEPGDQIQYSVEVQNNTDSQINDVFLRDLLSGVDFSPSADENIIVYANKKSLMIRAIGPYETIALTAVYTVPDTAIPGTSALNMVIATPRGGNDYSALEEVDIYKTYTVTYNANGGTGAAPTDSADYAYYQRVTVLPNPGIVRDGWIFAGWGMAPRTDALYQGGDGFNITRDTVLYAQWRKIRITKEVSPVSANAGDLVTYTVSARNLTGMTLYDIAIADSLTDVVLPDGVPNMTIDQTDRFKGVISELGPYETVSVDYD